MGMFDYIICEYPLPDGFTASDEFQSKDLDCMLSSYIITSDGRLILDNIDCHYDGTLNFYNSNTSSSGPFGFTTRNDEPYWSQEYEATFFKGQLTHITGGDRRVNHSDHPHIMHDEYRAAREQEDERIAALQLVCLHEIKETLRYSRGGGGFTDIRNFKEDVCRTCHLHMNEREEPEW